MYSDTFNQIVSQNKSSEDALLIDRILMGLANHSALAGIEDNILEKHRGDPRIFETKTPITGTDIANLFKEKNADATIELGDLNPDLRGHFERRLKAIGRMEFAEDGTLTIEEYLVAEGELGNARRKACPENFGEPDAETVAAAQAVLEQHDIYDPNGELAEGLAIAWEKTAADANAGLGIEVPPAPAPGMEASLVASQDVAAPDLSR